MKTIFFLLVFSLSFCVCNGRPTGKAMTSQGLQTEIPTIIKTLKSFYVSYSTNYLQEQDNNSLLRAHLTEGLIAKIERMKLAIQADPIIRAQDFSEEAIKTLQVKHLDKNWYMVSYSWTTNNDKWTNIPVRVNKINGHYMIDYITPEWNGSMYGDSLLYVYPKHQSVDASSPMSLLKTFYAAYTMKYCNMPADLTQQLDALRTKYCTNKALAQFNAAIDIDDMDYAPGYDLVIDYFDFDPLWIHSITYTQLNDDTYQMRYTKWQNAITAITLKIIKQGQEYKIDEIQIEK
ncbi:MAG: DUF3828 domain-containing protein [Paludibacteraceae bacterium]|nr:DUF3828 domain-containing protein [Paludibacteraceae bacterium]